MLVVNSELEAHKIFEAFLSLEVDIKFAVFFYQQVYLCFDFFFLIDIDYKISKELP